MPSLTTIKRGSLLLAEGTLLPKSVLLESRPCVPAWGWLENATPKGLKELIQQAGWNFFYLATELETTGWGWDTEAAMQKAIRRITAQTKAAQYNCVEIKHVEARQFLGISVVKMTAHSRQIQEKSSLAAGRARLSYASE